MSESCLNTETMPCPLHLQVSADTKQGGRNYMEDFIRIKIADVNFPGGQVAYLAVFDGHGGPEAARFAQTTLGAEIARLMGTWDDDNDATVVKAIKQAFVNTHKLMNKFVGMWPKTISGLPSTAGTTASVVIIRGEKLYVAHVGDSTVVLGKDDPRSCSQDSNEINNPNTETSWAAQCLTTDHKPECPVERRRIEESGGAVIAKAGVHRVVWYRPRNARASNRLSSGTVSGPDGACLVDTVPFLAVARALGDLWSYNRARDVYVVSPEPDVSIHRLDKSVHCVILASDGVWNMVTAIEAVETVQFCVQQCKLNESNTITSSGDHSDDSSTRSTGINTPAEKLVSLSLDRWSSKRLRADNTSAIVVIFDHDNNTHVRPDALTEFCSDHCDLSDINETTFISSPHSLPQSSVPFCDQLAELNFQSKGQSTRENGNGEVGMETNDLQNQVSNSFTLAWNVGNRSEMMKVRSRSSDDQVTSSVESGSSNCVAELAVVLYSQIPHDENQFQSMDVIAEQNSADAGSSLTLGIHTNPECNNSFQLAQDTRVTVTNLLSDQVPCVDVSESVVSKSDIANDRAFPEFISDKSSFVNVGDLPLTDCRLMHSPISKVVVLSSCIPECDSAVTKNICELAHSVNQNKESLSPNAIKVLNPCVDDNDDDFSICNARSLAGKSATAPCRLISSKKRKAKKQIMSMEKKVMHAVCSTMHVKRHLTRYHVEQIHVKQS